MTPEDIPGDPRDILGDHLRDEMLDRQWEEQQANRVPTPEADECYHYCVTHSGPGTGLIMRQKMRDLETRLTLARDALERISIWATENSVLSVARNALTQTNPKP